MDEPVPIEGIVEGEPRSLAVVCAAGGSAILAYCSAVGAQDGVAETVVTALATFRRGVVEHADRDPSQLQELLLSCTAAAARRVAGVDPPPVQQAAAQVALETAVTEPLAPGLAARVIRALVEAAPVSALDGDAAAVRRATQQHYGRMFDGQETAAAAPAATEGGWVPSEIAGLDAEAANARAVLPRGQRRSAPPEAAPAEPEVVAPPLVAPPPGALVIKRGGHWPFRRRPRPSSGARFRGTADGTRNAVLAAVAGLALGAGIVAVALPEEEEARRDSVLVRAIDQPFTVDGAVFNVARTNQAEWARAIRERPLRPGRTWLTLAAQTRNIDRPNFLPRSLGYRLRTPAGIVIGPDAAQVPAEITLASGRLPAGERSSVHLGFQIPSGQRGLTLEFDPSRGGPRIRVPLN